MKRFSISRKRSLIALVLCVAMVLGLTGCGKNGNNANKDDNAADVVYVAEYIDVQGIENVINLKEKDGILHILSAEYTEEGTTFLLHTYNLADGSTTEAVLEGATENGYFSSTYFNEDGSLEVIELAEEYDEEWNLISSETYFNKYGEYLCYGKR